MKRFLFILCITTMALVSCKSNSENLTYWGNVNYYDNYLWRKYIPDTLEKVLQVGYNDNAYAELETDIVLGLYQWLSDNNYAKTTSDNVELYVNGIKSEDNTIRICRNNCDKQKIQRIKIGIVLTDKMLHSEKIDRDYRFVFKVIGNPGIDRINDFNMTKNDSNPYLNMDKERQTPMIIKVRHVSNKLQVWVDSILSFIGIVVIVIAVLWLTIIKVVKYPKIKVAIDINGAYYLHKPKNRFRMIVLCDNNYKKQSSLNKLLTGEILYSMNEMWCDGPVVIKPSGKTVRLKLGDKYTIKPYDLTLDKDVEYKITNSLKQSVQITVS